MDKREFDGLLRAKTPIQSAFFFGGCDYLADKYTAMLLATLPQGNDISKMYFDEYMFDEAKTILSQNSLFGDIPVLLLKHEKKFQKKNCKNSSV